MADERLGVLLADPDRLFRAGLGVALQQTADLRVLAEAEDASQLLAVLSTTVPDVVVLSLHLAPDPMALRVVVERCHPARVVVLADDHDHGALLLAVDAGATGFVSTRSPLDTLVATLQAVGRGESAVPPEMLGGLLAELVDRSRRGAQADRMYGALSRREKEVLALLAEGCDSSDVAARLVISPQTARSHICKVLSKLGVHSRAEATAFALRLGLGAAAEGRPA